MGHGPERELASICAGVQAAASGQPFERDGTTLMRQTAGGMTQVVHFYLNPRGSDTFQVTLGARAEGFSRDTTAFPSGLDLDVSGGLGPAGDRYWSLNNLDNAIADIQGLLNRYGERWFSHFDSVERALDTLESLPPEDTSQTWAHPRLVAMRLRAQRGELIEAERDLREHLAQRGGQLRHRELPYGVILARASEYGVPLPEGSEPYVRLGHTWRATRLVFADRYGDSVDTPPVRVWLDLESNEPVVSFRGPDHQVVSTAPHDIICEVGRYLATRLSTELHASWPACPDHGVGLSARQADTQPAWYCDSHQHVVCNIGDIFKHGAVEEQ